MLSKKTAGALVQVCQCVSIRTLMQSGARLQHVPTAEAPLTVLTVLEAYTPQNMPQQIKDLHYPAIGNRDIVGGGLFQGNPSYLDMVDFPMPGVRWAANTPKVLALRQKEVGDWKALTLDEKKQLYRNSYCKTFAEMDAPTGDWMRILAYCCYGIALAVLLFYCHVTFVYVHTPETTSQEHTKNMLTRMVKQHQGRLSGVASQYDYEKGQWKK